MDTLLYAMSPAQRKERHHHAPHPHAQGWRSLLGRLAHRHTLDPFEHVDPHLAASAQGIRTVKLSLVALLLTALLQGLAVVASGSVALLSDTLHNLGDALTALPLWLAFSIGRRPRSHRYTYGYGRLEDLAGVFVVALIAVSVAVALYESIDRLLNPQPVDHLGYVFAASLVGFAGNELVAIFRIRTGRRIGSAALVADGLHARTDGLTSLAVFAGSLGVAAGWEQADPVAGIVIAAAILVILKNAAADVYLRLVDAVDPRLVDAVKEVLLGVEGVRCVEDVRIRWIGHELRAEAQIGVDRNLTVADGHAIAVEAHHQLLHTVHRLGSAHIHVHPFPGDWREHHAPILHHLKPPPAAGGSAPSG